MADYPYKKRIIRILELLSSGRNVSVKLLDREFEGTVSLRTLQRDLQEISAILPVEIHTLKGRGIEYSLPRLYKDLLKRSIQQNELLALHTLKGYLRSLKGTRLDKDLHNLEEKLETMVPGEILLDLNDIQIYDQNRGYFDYLDYDDLITNLINFMTQKKWVSITYKPIDAERATLLKFFPQRLYTYNGSLYLLGVTFNYKDPISLLVQFIESAEIIDETVGESPEFSINSLRLNRFAVYNGEIEKIVFKVSPKIKRHFWRRHWHESQKITEAEDGSLIFEMTVPVAPDFISWILSWGQNIRVIEPEHLQKTIAEEAAKIVDLYKSK